MNKYARAAAVIVAALVAVGALAVAATHPDQGARLASGFVFVVGAAAVVFSIFSD